jgi:hypothetical protein
VTHGLSLLALTLANFCFGCEPKVRVATSDMYNKDLKLIITIIIFSYINFLNIDNLDLNIIH